MPRLIVIALQLLLDDHLRGDSRVIAARIPQHGLAVHTMPSDDRVLDGVGERVAEMETARDVGRWDDHREVALCRLAVLKKYENNEKK